MAALQSMLHALGGSTAQFRYPSGRKKGRRMSLGRERAGAAGYYRAFSTIARAMYPRTSSASATLSGFENLEEGRASQRKLASLSFDAAGFRPWPAYRSRCVRAIAQ
jgi:hypothetical protein